MKVRGISRLYARARAGWQYLGRLGIGPRSWLLPVALSLLAAAFEGVSLGALVPFLAAVLSGSGGEIAAGARPPWAAALPGSAAVAPDTLLVLGGAVVVGAALMKGAAAYAADVSVAALVRNVTHRLRQLVFDRYLSYGKLFFDRSSVGHLNQVLMSYTSQVANPLPQAHQIIGMGLSLLVYFVLLVLISWPLALFVALTLPFMNIAFRRLLAAITRGSYLQTKSINDFSKQVFNILSTIPLVKLYDAAPAERRRFARISWRVADLDFGIIRRQQLMMPVQEGMALLTMLLIVGAVALLKRQGVPMAPASLIVFFYLVLRSVTTYGRLHRFRGALAKAAGPLAELRAALHAADKHVVPDGTARFEGLKEAIVFDNLTFSYTAAVPVLRGVSFTVPARQVTALVGPTGSGKTTLVSLLLRLYDCPPGTIWLDGRDIREFAAASIRAHLAFVSQDAWLFHDTFQANLTYGLGVVADSAIEEALDRARLSELVKRLPRGLATEIGDRGVQLSGGEKQRLSIARALLKRAPVVIFDEPTSALDAETERLVQAALKEAMRNRTVIIIAHRLATIRHADSIVVLRDGRVVEQGTWEELARRRAGVFQAFWRAQAITA